jgi:hypothetical protein
MAAVFASAIDKACVAALEAAEADAELAWLAAAVLLKDFARSACSLLTCVSRSATRASMGLRSVHPAVIIRKAKMKPFPMVEPIRLCQSRLNQSGMSRTPGPPHSGLSAYCIGKIRPSPQGLPAQDELAGPRLFIHGGGRSI